MTISSPKDCQMLIFFDWGKAMVNRFHILDFFFLIKNNVYFPILCYVVSD